jgi:hypothetical protein
MRTITKLGFAGALGASCLLWAGPNAGAATSINVVPLGVFDGGGTAASEIVAYDPATQRMFITNGESKRVDIVDVSNASAPTFLTSIDITPWGADLQSVTVSKGRVAVAVKAFNPADNGSVVLFDTNGTHLATYPAGNLPDSVAFSPNGNFIVVANEGELVCSGASVSTDPVGSVTVIEPSTGRVRQDGFSAWNGKETQLKSQGIRIIRPGASAAQDLEPEYVAIDQTSRWAYVTLQENNAVAVVYLPTGTVKKLLPLGYKDHSKPGHGLDPSNSDGGPNIATWPVLGMYQPDSVASVKLKGSEFLVTANEGDARDTSCFSEDKRVKDYGLAVPPYAVGDGADAKLGRLKTTPLFPTTLSGGKITQVYAYGARSFTIWDTSGRRIFDSGDQFEQHTKNIPGIFNVDGATVDGRSDDKGPEPEALAVGTAYGRTYAFVGLERTGGFFVYDITDPRAATMVQYVLGGTDVSPEGMLFVKAGDSPTGRPMLLVAHEVSGTTRAYDIQLA